MRAVWMIGAIIALLTCAAAPVRAADPTVTDLGQPIYTAPFATNNIWPQLTWVGDGRLVYSGDGDLYVWEVGSGQSTVLPDRNIDCVAPGSSEPVVHMSVLRKVPKDSDNPTGRRISYWLIGPWSHLERASESDTISYDGATRQQTLSSGAVVRQWAKRDAHTGCRGLQFPDDTMPAHMVGPMQNSAPLFGGRAVISRKAGFQSRQPSIPVELYLADRPEPIQLPMTYCELGRWWSNLTYSEYKRAYLAWGRHGGYDDKRGECLPYAARMGSPLRYWWLFEDGHVEEGEVPPAKDAAFQTGPLPKDPDRWATRASVSEEHFYATAIGFVYYLTNTNNYEIYIVRDRQYVRIYRGNLFSNFKISPSGCRVAFAECPGAFAKSCPLRVIDLCQQVNPSK